MRNKVMRNVVHARTRILLVVMASVAVLSLAVPSAFAVQPQQEQKETQAADVGMNSMLMGGRAPLPAVIARLAAGPTAGIKRDAVAQATLTLGARATRQAGGAAVSASVTYNCPSGFSGFVSLVIAEVTGANVPYGVGSTLSTPVCDGRSHTITVSAIVVNDHPFRPGAAFAQAALSASSQTGFVDAGAERTLTIV